MTAATATVQTYPLKVVPGTLASVRRAELEGARFVDVRNIANLVYKNPDGSALLVFADTLLDRKVTFDKIIAYEIAAGWIVDDLGQQNAQAPAINGTQQNGTTQMQTPPPGQNFQQQPPPMATMAAPPPGVQMTMPPPAAPMGAAPPPGVMAPPGMQQGMPGSNGAMPPPGMQQQASAAQAAAVPAGAPQAQPEPAAPAGRKRRTAGGAAVAPPPAAPPPNLMQAPVPGQQQMVAPPGMQQAPMPAPASAPYTAPVGAMAAPGMAAAHQQPMAAPTELAGKVDKVGAGLEMLSGQVNELKSQLQAMSTSLAQSQRLNVEMLTCLHHVYGQFPALVQGLAGVSTLDDFRKYLGPFIGPQS